VLPVEDLENGVPQRVLPRLSRVALLSRPANPGHQQYVREAEIAARTLGVELQVLPVLSSNDYEKAFRDASGAGALLQVDDAVFRYAEPISSILRVSPQWF
jgi:ABC-type uncharacterized transport system substrate-binding protein